MIIARFQVHRSALLLSLCLAVPGTRAEAVTLGELEQTCKTALADGYRGVAAAACDWYLDPCQVCGVEPVPVTWCVPPGLTPAGRAGRVVASLRDYPAERTEPLEAHLAILLRAAFPCVGDDRAAGRG